MHKIRGLFAIAAVLVLAGALGWIATTTHAQAPVRSEGVNPSEIAMNAKNLPVEEFVDYSFVFI